MPSQYPVLDNKPIDQWRVAELREELKRRKLSTKGLKEELVKRLNEAIQEAELENGRELGGDDAEHDKDSQSNADDEEEDAANEDYPNPVSYENICDKDDMPININNDLQGSCNDDEIKSGGLASKNDQSVATTKELEKSTSYNQSSAPQSGMQADDAETDQKGEDSKPSLEGSAVTQLETSNQVPEIIQDLEFQVKYESNSTDSVSINEKNNIKDNLIADNFPLELEVKQEVKQPSFHNYSTVDVGSCIVGNVQETGDSRLIDEQEAGNGIVFDGRGINKDLFSNKQGTSNNIATNDEDVDLNHMSVKKEVVLEHLPLEDVVMLDAIEPEAVKQDIEKPSSHIKSSLGGDSCIDGNDQEVGDSQLTEEQEADKKLASDGKEIDKDAIFYKQEVTNSIATKVEDGYQNVVSVKEEMTVEHASLEDADMLNDSEQEVVKEEVKQPSSYSNPAVGESSCIAGNGLETGDSCLIVDKIPGNKLVFDGQKIDKELLFDKQEATNKNETNDEDVVLNDGLVKKEVVFEHVPLKDASISNGLELEVVMPEVKKSSPHNSPIDEDSCIVGNEREVGDSYLTIDQEACKELLFDGQEIDKDLLSDKQEVTHGIATSDEVIGLSHVSVKKGMVLEHTLLEDTDTLNASNVVPPNKEDFTDGCSEKLNFDRSSGDEFMEEDFLESKNMETDIQFHERTNLSKISKDNVNVVEWAADLETSKVSPEMKKNEYMKPPTVEKRKLEDDDAVGNNFGLKRQRRWNPDTVKVPEQQTTHFMDSTTPKNTEQSAVHRAFSRSNSTLTEDSPKERMVPAPKRPTTTSLRIDNFVRPFTLKAVQELLAKTGTVCDFWMDHIKTHCYVTYSSAEEATETRNAVYNLRWPPNGDRVLAAEFVDPREVKMRLEALPQSPGPISPAPITPRTTYAQGQVPPPPRQQNIRSQPPHSVPLLVQPPPPPPPPLQNPPIAREQLPPPPMRKAEPSVAASPPLNPPPTAMEQLPPSPSKKAEPPVVTLDDLFKKTKATPRIYYLPLSQEQVAAKSAAQAKYPQVQ